MSYTQVSSANSRRICLHGHPSCCTQCKLFCSSTLKEILTLQYYNTVVYLVSSVLFSHRGGYLDCRPFDLPSNDSCVCERLVRSWKTLLFQLWPWPSIVPILCLTWIPMAMIGSLNGAVVSLSDAEHFGRATQTIAAVQIHTATSCCREDSTTVPRLKL